MHRGVITLAMLALIGCGAPPAPCAVWPAPPPAYGREVPIRWIASEDGAALPVVATWVDGRAARLVVDSGANAHFVERSIVWWLGLPPAHRGADERSRALVASDASGGLVVVEAFGPADVRVGLRGAGGQDLVMTSPLIALVERGAGGFLSPQRLGHGRALELDLARSTLRVLDREEAAQALRPGAGWTALSPVCASDDGVPLFAIDVDVDGHRERMLVDTGSDRTFVPASSELGASLSARSTREARYATLGRDGSAALVDGVPIELAGRRVSASVRVDAIDGDGCFVQGAIGADILRGCRIVLSRERGALRCDG